jgi:hypothetical protein
LKTKSLTKKVQEFLFKYIYIYIIIKDLKKCNSYVLFGPSIAASSDRRKVPPVLRETPPCARRGSYATIAKCRHINDLPRTLAGDDANTTVELQTNYKQTTLFLLQESTVPDEQPKNWIWPEPEQGPKQPAFMDPKKPVGILISQMAQHARSQPIARDRSKAPDGSPAPELKIKCACSHPKRYHGHVEGSEIFYTGPCPYCNCQGFRERKATK